MFKFIIAMNLFFPGGYNEQAMPPVMVTGLGKSKSIMAAIQDSTSVRYKV